MATRQEFGNYLLLKKLSEDPLGESFRAGRLGQQGLDQVVLLRALNGEGLDTDRLWSTLSARRRLQPALKSPNIGSGVDAGTVRGVPYVAYDYISGKDLATLVGQAERESSPFPTDHALLIADRIGLALNAALEARLDGQRVLHGMVAPQLVMVSNEGETRLLGFAAGPALAEQAGVLPEEIQRYLAPENRSGDGPTRAGDVFSLGAILHELLTGTPLPLSAPEGYGPLVRQSRLAAEGTPMPSAMAELLERSLAPADQRIPDASAWHKALAKVAAEGGYDATTFNLAFFMHNLFREEIEREGKEIEAERTMELPARAAAGAPPAAEEGEAVAAAAAGDETGEVRERYGIETAGSAEASRPSGRGMWIGLAAVLLVAALGVGAWFYFGAGRGAPEEEVPAESVAEQPAAPAVPEPAVEEEPPQPAGPTPEELQAQIDEMLEEKTQAMQRNLQQEYDRRIREMQQQLAAAEEAAAERERRLEEAQRQAQAETQPEAPDPADAVGSAEEVAEEAPARGADRGQATVADGGGSASQPAGGDTGAAEAPTPAGQAANAADVARELAQRPAAEEREAPAEPEPEPEPAVRVGDLVKPGPGVSSPRVVRRAPAQYPPVAARLSREATVDVEILVDENGQVLEARIAGDEAGFGFDEAALEAARASRFEPARKEGVRVKMWTTLRFVFKR